MACRVARVLFFFTMAGQSSPPAGKMPEPPIHSREGTFMLKAVVSNGTIRPLEPLPADWQEGQPLRVEKVDDGEMSVEEIDRDFAVLTKLCETSEPADEEQLERALQEARWEAKERVRRQMGLA
ncbi:MAG TPA: hypothetical protein VKE94_01730 [Gemmataceae bacterium]|nr:hypothetical protein [Gemmataceae bacterium]